MQFLGGGQNCFFFLVQQCGGVKLPPPHSIRRNFLNVRWEGLVWEAQRISDSLGCFDYDIVLGIGSTRRLVEGQSALSEAWPEGKGNVIIFLDAAWMIWMFPKIGVPQNAWFIMETPIKMDDWGVP